MKKIVILTALLTMAISGSAFAAALATGNVTTAAGMVIRGGASGQAATATNPLGKMSTGVRLSVAYGTTGYALVTKHDTGSKQVGTSNDSTAIYFVVKPAGALTDVPTLATAGSYVSAFATGWTSM